MTSSDHRARFWVFPVLPPDFQWCCQQAPGPEPNPFPTFPETFSSPESHQLLLWYYTLTMNPENPVDLYFHSVFHCGWDEFHVCDWHTPGCDKKGRCYIGQEEQGLGSTSQESQPYTYWLIGPGGCHLWFQQNPPWANHLTSLSPVSSKGNGDNSCFSYLTKWWSLKKSKRDMQK